jgi:hypothetical protein
MRFFFYGSLLDPDVTALVLGRRLPPTAWLPAILPGHARRRIREGTYPIAVRDPRASILGAIVGGLSARDVARLSAYEGPRYRVAALKVRVGGAMARVAVFAPLEERFQQTAGAWQLEEWQRRHKRAFLARIRPRLSVR